MTHYHFIVNPAAAGGRCRRRFEELLPDIEAYGVSFSLDYTEKAGDGVVLAEKAVESGRDIIVAVGGDGTTREVASALFYKKEVSLGIIPCGTGNDFIKALGIPGDYKKALESLVKGQAREIDAAEVNGTPYINIAGMGFDVDVLEKATRLKRYVNGSLSYLLGLAHAALKLKLRRIRVISPERGFEEEVLLLVVSNGTHMGGGMKITPHSLPGDGFLDICIVRNINRRKVLKLIWRFMKDGYIPKEFAEYFRVTELRVESEDKLSLQLDGEIIESTPAVFKIMPGALRIILPVAD